MTTSETTTESLLPDRSDRNGRTFVPTVALMHWVRGGTHSAYERDVDYLGAWLQLEVNHG